MTQVGRGPPGIHPSVPACVDDYWFWLRRLPKPHGRRQASSGALRKRRETSLLVTPPPARPLPAGRGRSGGAGGEAVRWAVPCGLGRLGCRAWASSRRAGGPARRSGKACVRRGGNGSALPSAWPSLRSRPKSSPEPPAWGVLPARACLASSQNPVLFVLRPNSPPFLFLSLFKKSPPKIPYKAIALATVLFLIGAFLIIIGSLLLSGYISKGGADRAIPVLIIGILVFLPGFYHLRIAYYASKGYRGYSYDDIPDFDD
uniref:Transmembrane protein 230 n=1 Tax=Oryctolagus cuniculus TaxID=9986 RepID=A0A5F9CTS5_RABIT